jgi:hypothetical protein
MIEQVDRREHREDARFILRALVAGAVTEDHALDLLGFGEPLRGDQRARGQCAGEEVK